MQCAMAGRNLYMRFSCSTGDAMGMNMISKGVPVAITSDGVSPSRHFDMLQTARLAQFTQHLLHNHDRYLLPPGKVFEMITIDAARALGMDHEIGSLEIGKKADIAIPGMEDEQLLREPAEFALAEAVEAAYGETGHALAHGDYVDVLAHLARLRPQVDAFFDSVMVNVDDPAIRANRLALLKRLSDRLGSVAAIEHLSA